MDIVELMGARNSFWLYFAMMKRSFSSWDEFGSGFRYPRLWWSLDSHMEFATSLPSEAMTARWPGGHSSRSRDLTLEMCEPSFRWTPEHSMHISTPKLMLAQSGSKEKDKLQLLEIVYYRSTNVLHFLFFLNPVSGTVSAT